MKRPTAYQREVLGKLSRQGYYAQFYARDFRAPTVRILVRQGLAYIIRDAGFDLLQITDKGRVALRGCS